LSVQIYCAICGVEIHPPYCLAFSFQISGLDFKYLKVILLILLILFIFLYLITHNITLKLFPCKSSWASPSQAKKKRNGTEITQVSSDDLQASILIHSPGSLHSMYNTNTDLLREIKFPGSYVCCYLNKQHLILAVLIVCQTLKSLIGNFLLSFW